MIRRAIAMLLCLTAAVLGIGLFLVKHEVKSQESYLAQLNRDILRGQEAIHVLNAEWSYLNDPVRLRSLAEKHLGMTVVKPTQIATLGTLDGHLRGDISIVPPVMVAKVPVPAVQPSAQTTQVASVKPVGLPPTSVAATAPMLRDDAASSRRVVVPSPAYRGPSTYTPAPYSAPSYAAVSTNRPAPDSAAMKRRVIVVPSPALARAPLQGGAP